MNIIINVNLVSSKVLWSAVSGKVMRHTLLHVTECGDHVFTEGLVAKRNMHHYYEDMADALIVATKLHQRDMAILLNAALLSLPKGMNLSPLSMENFSKKFNREVEILL